MKPEDALLTYTLRLGDTALVLGQRLVELVAHGPELEEELANANLALDYIGQARMFYSHAGKLEGAGRNEDDFAYLRDGHQFANFLLVEQPNVDFGNTIVRQVLFETFYLQQLEALTRCSDPGLAEIAARAVKEIRYHLRHVSQWLLRLGDGTDESHARAQDSLHRLWRYCGELFAGDEVDELVRTHYDGPDLPSIREHWEHQIGALLAEATLEIPDEPWMSAAGRQGVHTEHFGFLIAEMQFLRRAYPETTW